MKIALNTCLTTKFYKKMIIQEYHLFPKRQKFTDPTLIPYTITWFLGAKSTKIHMYPTTFRYNSCFKITKLYPSPESLKIILKDNLTLFHMGYFYPSEKFSQISKILCRTIVCVFIYANLVANILWKCTQHRWFMVIECAWKEYFSVIVQIHAF